METKTVVSAGGVVWRPGKSGVEVALCGRRDPLLWALPKGTPDSGETLLRTAEREVREETGLTVRTTGKIGTIQYWFVRDGVRYRKFVHHYLMEPTGGDVSLHDEEYDEVEWVPAAEALRRLSYQNEAKMLEKALAEIENASRGAVTG